MYHFTIFSVGKTKEDWLEQALEEYLKRLKPTAAISFIWAKNEAQLETAVIKEAEKSRIVCLDASGQLMDSEEFSSFLLKQLEEGGSRLGLVIGGPEGLPPVVKKRFPLLSLSRLTFTHQMARLILIEQIYRAFEIAKQSRYHK